MVPAVIAAISAIAALAQAGGAMKQGQVQGDTLDEQEAANKRKLLMDQQNRDQDIRIGNQRYADTLATQRRSEAQNAPANSINLLSGLNGLRNSNSHANGLDVLGMLAGR